MSAIAEVPPFSYASNAIVCNWYFAMFAFTSLMFGIYAIANIYKFGAMKILPVWAKVFIIVSTIAFTSVAVGNAGFQFTMCKRALSV